MIEGGVNAQLRAMMREHRGMSDLRRVKAVFWWCYMHTEDPLPAREILELLHFIRQFDEGLFNRRERFPAWQTPSTPGTTTRRSSAR